MKPNIIAGPLFNVYSAVERLLMYQNDTLSSDTSVCYKLFHELWSSRKGYFERGDDFGLEPVFQNSH